MLAPLEDDPWLALVLTMMFERAKGGEGRWSAYFDVLPREFDSLMWWSEEELAELQASGVRGRIGREEADERFREQLVPIVRAHRALFGAPEEGLVQWVVHEVHVLASTIMAYAFDVEPERQEREVDEEGYVSEEDEADMMKGMVPLADILNADADLNNVSRLFDE